ncbi:glycosyltransferase family 4 protein [Vallitalea sediminicola]
MNSREDVKRIAFIIGCMGRGGAERVISILANHYAEKGWQVDILLLLNNRCDYQLNRNIKIIPICNENKSKISYLPKWMYGIRKYIIQNKPDRIVSFVARINIITILASIGLNKHIVVSERNDPASDGRSIIVRLATRILYPLVDCVVFQTKWAQSCFSKRVQNKSEIILNPIHVNTVASNNKEKKIVAVGRLLEQKNHAMLIRAFKKVNDEYSDYKLYIYGEGKLRDVLTKQIQELELVEAVFLPGNVSDIHEKIADAEVFVLSSNYEGLSNALLEAMMMGLPCISTDCAGANEVIQNGENGLLIPIGVTDKLIEAMKELTSNREFAIQLGEEAEITSQEFAKHNVLKKWEEVIEN